MTPLAVPQRPVPLRAVLLSLAALAAPVLGAVWFQEAVSGNELLLWLAPLIPAFLLAYYRGWHGVAVAQSLGMAVLALTQVLLTLTDQPMQDPSALLGVVAPYVAVSLGIGWVSDALHRERQDAERRAITDELTGLPNRRMASLFLDSQFAAARRGKEGLALVFFDLDSFKDYNDRHGHAAGDEALRVFGKALGDETRSCNLSARWGGEEFVSVVRESDAAGVKVFVDRVRARLRERPPSAGPITVSAGIAVYHRRLATTAELLVEADRALYEAKAAGRDCVRAARTAAVPPDERPARQQPTEASPIGA